MSLQIEQRESQGVVILDLKGPLAFGQGDSELRDRLAALHQTGNVNIVLNLKDVSHIDSAGLGTLVFGLARLRKAGGKLALIGRRRSIGASLSSPPISTHIGTMARGPDRPNAPKGRDPANIPRKTRPGRPAPRRRGRTRRRSIRHWRTCSIRRSAKAAPGLEPRPAARLVARPVATPASRRRPPPPRHSRASPAAKRPGGKTRRAGCNRRRTIPGTAAPTSPMRTGPANRPKQGFEERPQSGYVAKGGPVGSTPSLPTRWITVTPIRAGR